MHVIQTETAELHGDPHQEVHKNPVDQESENYEEQRENINMYTTYADIDHDHIFLNRSLDVSPAKQQTCTITSDTKKIPPIIISYGYKEATTISDINLASSALTIDDISAIQLITILLH